MSAGITAGARGAAAGLGQASAGNARTLPRPRKPGLKSKSRGLETTARAAVERREASAPEAGGRPWRAPRPKRGQVATSVRVVRPIRFAPSGAPPPFIYLEAKHPWLSFLPQNSGAKRAARTRLLYPPLQGEGRGPKGRGVGCAAAQGFAARCARFHPIPPRFAIADAPRRRSLRRMTAAKGRLWTFPLQGKVKKGDSHAHTLRLRFAHA